MTVTERHVRRRSRALAHQCPSCRRHWALHVVQHPEGRIISCRYCFAPRSEARVAGARVTASR